MATFAPRLDQILRPLDRFWRRDAGSTLNKKRGTEVPR